MTKMVYINYQMFYSVLIVKIIVLISFWHIFDSLSLLFLFVLLLNPWPNIFWNSLMDNRFTLSCYDIKVSIILFDNIL